MRAGEVDREEGDREEGDLDLARLGGILASCFLVG